MRYFLLILELFAATVLLAQDKVPTASGHVANGALRMGSPADVVYQNGPIVLTAAEGLVR